LLAEQDGDTGAALREVIWLDDLPVGWVDAAAGWASSRAFLEWG
jgi:hypothetical protein